MLVVRDFSSFRQNRLEGCLGGNSAMKNLFRLFFVVSVFLFSGCIPSLNPIYTYEDAVFDEKLVGMWESVHTIEETDPGNPSLSNWKTLDFDETNQKSFDLVTSSFEGKKGHYIVHMVRIGEAMFLDLFPGESDSTDKRKEYEEFFSNKFDRYFEWHYVPFHTFIKIEIIGDSLRISTIDSEWFEKYNEKNPEEVRTEFLNINPDRDFSRLVITDTTKNLQKFLGKHVNTEGAFKDKFTFKRKSRISKIRVKRRYGKIKTISEATEIIKEYPEEVQIYQILAQLLTREGKFDEALADYSKTIELEPSNSVNYFKRAIVYVVKGEYDLAIADFSKSIELEPSNSVNYFKRAIVYVVKGEYDLAETDLRKAIELSPRYIDAFYLRANVYRVKGEYDLAIADLTRAIELSPKYVDAYNDKAWILATSTDAKYRDGVKAIELAKKAVELSPASYIVDTLAAAYAEAGRFEDAVTTQKRAISLHKNEDRKILSPSELKEHLKAYKAHKPWRE